MSTNLDAELQAVTGVVLSKPVAKRSPILGYNHNVRYRGLIFHVQTEDSGVLSPHLFTHLFHEGVIVSTRKLVYDAGASEDAIKALMQAQHKAVLKDLKLRMFDDKIDAYLGAVPGLEPREGGPPPKQSVQSRVSEPEITIEPGSGEHPVEAVPVETRAGTEPSAPPIEAAELSEPAIELPPKRQKRKSTVPPPKDAVVTKPRTQTAERTSKSSQFRSMQPPDAAPIASRDGGPTIPNQAPTRPTPPPPTRAGQPRAATPPPVPQRSGVSKTGISLDSQPEIEIIRDGDSGRARGPRDTAVDNSFEDAIPAAVLPDATVPSDGVPSRMPVAAAADRSQPNLAPDRPNSASRPPSHGAATLPAVRPPSRPAIAPPSVVSRPLPPTETGRVRGDSEAIEIYSPAAPSVDPPPGERTERPGQYSVNRRKEIQSQENVPLRDHTGRVAIPAGLARPRPPQPQPQPAGRTGAPSSPPIPAPPVAAPLSAKEAPRSGTQPPSDGVPQLDSRTSTPQRAPHLTAPIASRTGTGSTAAGNVITTRPAVIVGAPPKQPGAPQPPRVRKAREDEGRGFGQGLISEKSLDEVILAYLSEDADDK
ncbi:MAG: hypothetical protein QM831_18750 [Kofleriaceae bacterium]